MEDTWIVVADSTRARLFRKISGQRIREFKVLLNPEGRLREQDLVSDAPGRGLNRPRGGRFGMVHTEDHVKQSGKAFAHLIAAHLQAARREGRLKRLHLLAAPGFLGQLRRQLDAGTRALVQSESARNVARLDQDSLREILPDYL